MTLRKTVLSLLDNAGARHDLAPGIINVARGALFTDRDEPTALHRLVMEAGAFRIRPYDNDWAEVWLVAE